MNALRAPIVDFASSGPVPEREREKEGVMDAGFARAVDAVFTLDEQRGQRLAVEASDTPYEALIDASKKLRAFGLSSELADETVEAMEEQLIHLGVDFTKKEKPTPLKLFFGVVDKKPELDDDKVNFMVAWDREKRYGASYSTIGMSFVNRGGKNTKITQTNTPDLENMFTGGGEKYLVFWCEKIQADGVGGLDEKGAQLASVLQALGPVAASGDAGSAVMKAVEAGTVSPQVMELVQSVAEVRATVATAKFEGGAQQQAVQKLADIKRDIPAQVMAAAADKSIPAVIVKAVNKTMDAAMPAQPQQQQAAVKAEPKIIEAANTNKGLETAVVPAVSNNVAAETLKAAVVSASTPSEGVKPIAAKNDNVVAPVAQAPAIEQPKAAEVKAETSKVAEIIAPAAKTADIANIDAAPVTLAKAVETVAVAESNAIDVAAVKPAEIKAVEVVSVAPVEIKPVEIKSEAPKVAETKVDIVKAVEIVAAESAPVAETKTLEVAVAKPVEIKAETPKVVDAKIDAFAPVEVKPVEINAETPKAAEVKVETAKAPEAKAVEVVPVVEAKAAEVVAVTPAEMRAETPKFVETKIDAFAPVEVRPVEIKSETPTVTEIKPLEIKADSLKTAEVKPVEITSAAEMKAPETVIFSPAEVKAEIPKFPETKPAEAKISAANPAEIKIADVQPLQKVDVQVAHDVPAKEKVASTPAEIIMADVKSDNVSPAEKTKDVASVATASAENAVKNIPLVADVSIALNTPGVKTIEIAKEVVSATLPANMAVAIASAEAATLRSPTMSSTSSTTTVLNVVEDVKTVRVHMPTGNGNVAPVTTVVTQQVVRQVVANVPAGTVPAKPVVNPALEQAAQKSGQLTEHEKAKLDAQRFREEMERRYEEKEKKKDERHRPEREVYQVTPFEIQQIQWAKPEVPKDIVRAPENKEWSFKEKKVGKDISWGDGVSVSRSFKTCVVCNGCGSCLKDFNKAGAAEKTAQAVSAEFSNFKL